MSDRKQNYACMSASDWKCVCSEIRLIDFFNSYFKNKKPFQTAQRHYFLLGCSVCVLCLHMFTAYGEFLAKASVYAKGSILFFKPCKGRITHNTQNVMYSP